MTNLLSPKIVAPALFALLGALGLVLVTAGHPASAARAAACPNADKTVADVGAGKLGKAVVCLIAKERAQRERQPLRKNGKLQRVARKHTQVMVRKKCFRHRCKGEASLDKRIVRSGYIKDGRFGYGQNLGCSDTPQEMLRVWMKKRYHRKVILDRRFEHVGIGARKGSPLRPGDPRHPRCAPGREHVTYTLLLAWRSR